MTRNDDNAAARPLCPRCQARPVYRGGYLCTGCSHDKPARNRVNRPPDDELEATGLRLNLNTGELIDSEGRGTHAPPGLALNYFFGERDAAGVVDLLRPRAKGVRHD